MEEQVKSIFSSISSRYELANTLLSFGRDRFWRRKTVEMLSLEGDEKVLDVCAGTGNLAFSLAERLDRGGRVIGVDFCQEMLGIAAERVRKEKRKNLEFKKANALSLPFPSAYFDVVTIAFGLRNLTDREKGLKEFKRVLKKGGKLAVLEFSPPLAGLKGKAHRFYLNKIVPFLGGLVSGEREAYAYLASSIMEFPLPDELSLMILSCGFSQVSVCTLTFGAVSLHLAKV